MIVKTYTGSGDVLETIDKNSARYKFGGDPMAEYLHRLSLDSSYDDASGDVEAPTGWFARFGKRILRSDSQGFVWCEKYDTETAAEAMFAALDHYYGIWGDEESYDLDDIGDSPERAADIDDADAYIAYVGECDGRHVTTIYDHDDWVANDRPARPPAEHLTGFDYHAWVCVDCYFVHHYGYEADNIDENGLIRETGLKAMGRLDDVHPFRVTDNTDSETGEGIEEFSWRNCAGCGSTLGGARYRLAIWEA